jgi:Flp pilus assembly protein TadG
MTPDRIRLASAHVQAMGTSAVLRRFGADDRGVSAVEFALLLPLMLTLYLGGVEVSQAVSADRKTSLVAHTVGDLVAQASTISNSDVTNIMAAATAVAYPFSSANLNVVVSSVIIDANGKATIAWSEQLNGSKRSGDVTSLIPAGLKSSAGSLIWAEATYNYTPTIGYVITGTLKMGDKIFLRPRLSATVERK